MMTNLRVIARTTEFVLEKFPEQDLHARNEFWDNGSMTVTHIVTLPVGNHQAVIKASADEKVVSISMTLCSDTQMTTTSLSNQNEIRPEEFEGLLDHHLGTLMDLANEYVERASIVGPDVLWTMTLDPEDDLEPQF